MSMSALGLSDSNIARGLAARLRTRRLGGPIRAISRPSIRCRRLGASARLSPTLALVAVTCVTGVGSASAQAAVFTDISLPTISGKAVEGETLSETPATWSAQPTRRSDQWQRCNNSGHDCEAIAKATGQTYRLAAGDVGFTIRVSESASNTADAVTPALSEPTAVVVKAGATGGHGGEPSGGGGSSGNSPGSCCSTPTRVGTSEIESLLARQLLPAGKAASIPALLAHDGLSTSFTFPEAGTLTVKWYLLPTQAKVAKKSAGRATLVATGQARFAAAGKLLVRVSLTAGGRKLLRHAGKLHLEIKGAFAVKGQSAVSASKSFTLKR
jgi:hypothetical protein